MTPAQKILEMIENVDPADKESVVNATHGLYLWLNDRLPEWIAKIPIYLFPLGKIKGDEYGITCTLKQAALIFLFSRDALKAIRPEGYWCEFKSASDGDWVAILGRNNEHGINLLKFMSNYRPTEELAELHAIIQAIEWERNNGKI